MSKIQDGAAFLFISAVTILTGMSVLGVWDIFNRDVIVKSFATLGLLAVVAVIVMISGKFIDNQSQEGDAMMFLTNPAFKTIRQIAVTILIVSVSLLAILGVLAIWEVISDKNVLYKSMSSVGVLAFGTFIIVMTSLAREGKNIVSRQGKGMSVGAIILLVILGYIVLRSLFFF